MATEAEVIHEEPATTLVPINANGKQLESWSGAAARGLVSRKEREEIIRRVLIPGEDYGVIPGTDKPTLYKSGAEKVADSLNLYPDYEELVRVEDWSRPLFHYRYRCHLRQRGTDITIATGIGSCNSMESRYRWRQSNRACPTCGQETIIKGKAEFGGGWLCWPKKGGCGAKFRDGSTEIESQSVGRVENDDVFSQVNTIDKMGLKRALVCACLNLGFSGHFTQDLEDGTVATVDERKPTDTEAITAAFAAFHVTQAQLEEWIGRAMPLMSLDDIGRLRGLYGAMKEGKTWEQLTGKQPDKLDAVTAAMKAKRAADKTKEEIPGYVPSTDKIEEGPPEPPPPADSDEPVIGKAEVMKLWAVVRGKFGKEGEPALRIALKAIGVESTTKLSLSQYDELMADVASWEDCTTISPRMQAQIKAWLVKSSNNDLDVYTRAVVALCEYVKVKALSEIPTAKFVKVQELLTKKEAA